jgi:Pentapeptide repeats (9 copies)
MIETTNALIPWPGPKPYDELDWQFFFGREGHVDDIRQKLARERLTVLLGSSGSGKTSLIRAGLVPLLRNRRYHPASRTDEGPVLVFRGWGATSKDTARDLLELQLETALDAIRLWHGRYPEQAGAESDVQELKRVLDAHKGKEVVLAIEALARAVAGLSSSRRSSGPAQTAPLILVFDQLEELLRSKDRRSERDTGKVGEEMLALIGTLYARDSPLKMLISMREEYLYALRPLDRSVAHLSERCHYLDPLKPHDAKEVVARVCESPGVIRVHDEIMTDIVREPPAGAESSADLLRLQAVLYALSSHARQLGAAVVDRSIYDHYLAKTRVDDVGGEDEMDEIFQKAIEGWIESAVIGEASDDGSRQSGSTELEANIRAWTELDDEDLNGQVRRIAVRMAPYLSSSDYKVPQEQNNLFRRALGPVIATLAPESATLLEKLSIDSSPGAGHPNPAAHLNWGGDAAAHVPQGDQNLSGPARARAWPAAKTGDVIAACYLLALHRLEERNVLRRTFSARNEIVCELVHDQMGPMLVRWAENLRGGWPDSVSSLVALSGGPPITVADDRVLKGPFVSLAWRGCTVQAVQPRVRRLIFESSVFDRCELRGIVFDHCTFRGVHFNECVLAGTVFRDCIFEPGPDGSSSVISDSLESALDCLLFLKCTISDVEFRNCIVRQPSIVASTLNGDVVFENCAVAQLYASKLKGREDARIRIPASNKAWCCSADEGSFPLLEVRKARHGAGTSPEPEDFVPDKPTAGLH